MGSFAGEEEYPGGVTGADAEVGALVWVRRRNGSWWPGRILGMDELPDNCVIPPRSAGTPIKLLGRPDGSIDWYNLEKSKRVKSFRCGEYDECIEKAKVLARQQKRTHAEGATGRYVRREDAIMHALEIERSRFPNKDDDLEEDSDDDVCPSQNFYSAKSKNINGLNKRTRNTRGLYDAEENSGQDMSHALVVYKQPQNMSSSSTRYASSSGKRKRKGRKNLKDDTVRGSQRMRDLREIGTKNVPKQKFGAGIFSDGNRDVPLLESGPSFGYDLSSTNGIKKSKQSHSSIKRKRSNIGQSYENSRKKDRRRPLSQLCEDSEVTIPTFGPWNSSGQSSSQYHGDQMPNLFEPTRPRTSVSTDVNNCSYSSGASSLETLLDTSHTNHAGAAKATVKDGEVSCTTGFVNNDCSGGDEFFDALALEGDILEEGHLNTYGSCTSIKDQFSKLNNQTTESSKVGMSSVQHQRSSKKKSLSSVTPISEEINMDKNLLLRQYEGTIKLDGSVCKATELEGNMRSAMPEHDESSETISNHSNSEKGTVSFPYYVPLQVIMPEQQPDLKPPRCHVVRPTKRALADCRLYDVEVAVQRSHKGHHAPIVSLMSKWTGKPIVGYPVTVEVLENSRPTASRDEHHPAMGSLDSLLRSGAAEPRQARSSHKSRSKSGGRKKVSEHDLDKSWRPHTKKPASSPRKMRRLSSFSSSRRESVNRNPVVAKTGGPTVACVPLRLVFSRINEALSFPVRQENPT
ncbi:hypothetical protein EJB05_15944 [Eragrostis curvula]|uniref:PWWP domain-containing protein n=1 Tax=Eragrostis curvula TaxID=38414 RepID=A0A5J9VDT3_9POAL|nr:hypothetical protein EJB05_15944 [Eragrostis curvula]